VSTDQGQLCPPNSLKLVAAPALLTEVEGNRAATVDWANTAVLVGTSQDESETRKVQLAARRLLDSTDESAEVFRRWQDLPNWTTDRQLWARSAEAVVNIGFRAMLRCISIQVLVAAGSFSPDPAYRAAVSGMVDTGWSAYRSLLGPVVEQTTGHPWNERESAVFVKRTLEDLDVSEATLSEYSGHAYLIVRILADRAG
jgi:hypothetical protein